MAKIKARSKEIIRLPTLNKQCIFSNWKFKFFLFLELKGILEVLLVKLTKKTNNEDFKKKDSEAKLWIVQSVDDELLDVVRNCTTAQQMIMKLEAQFQRKTAFSKYDLKKQLLTMRLETSDSLQTHFKNFDQLISELEAIGCKLDESDKVCHLLLTLPEEYKVIIISLDEMLSMVESGQLLGFVKTQLLESEIRVKRKQTNIGIKVNENPTSLEVLNINVVGNSLFQTEKMVQLENDRCLTPVSVANSDSCKQHSKHTSLEAISTPEPCGGVMSNHNSIAPSAECRPDVPSQPAELHNGLTAAATGSHCDEPIPEHTLNTDTEMNRGHNVDDGLSLNITDRFEFDEPLIFSPDHECEYDFNSVEYDTDSDTVESIKTVSEDKAVILDCNVKLKDVTYNLWCAICDLWFLTPIQLENHKPTHTADPLMMKSEQIETQTLQHCSEVDFHDNSSDPQIESQNPYNISKFENHAEVSQPMDLDIPGNQFENLDSLPQTTSLENTTTILHSSSYCPQSELLAALDATPGLLISPKTTVARYPRRKEDIQLVPVSSSSDVLLVGSKSEKEHQIKKPISCHICTKVFISRHNLARHMRLTHEPVSKKPYTRKNNFFCDYCDKGFPSRSKKVDHIVVHTKEKNFKCDICKKSFTLEYTLKCHIRNIHSGDKPFACEICEKRFTFVTFLKKHLLTHGEKKFECDQCGRRCTTKRILKAHLVTHSEARPVKCNVCHKGFKRKDSLTYHMITHSDRKPLFYCQTCGKGFASRLSLNSHRAVHAENRFFCDHCEKGFRLKNKLIRHLETHRKDKAFSCKICEKRFNRKLYLDRHEVTHKDRPYACNVCGQRFFYKSTLNRHMRAPHSEHSGPKRDRNPRK